MPLLFSVLLLIPYTLSLLLMYVFEREYYNLLACTFVLYQYKSIAFLCLFFYKSSIPYQCGSISHRIFHFYHDMTTMFRIHYDHLSIVLVAPSVCWWSFLVKLSIVSEFVSTLSNYVCLVFLGLVLSGWFDNRDD